MSILSTSSKLVRVGDSYSAGEGISIENHVISVTGDYGHTYYPGENISISDDNVISSKDWSSDIDTAAQNVSAETTAWVSEQGYITDASLSDYALITDVETTSGLLKMDIDAVSASITGKMDSTAFSDWQSGQYTNDIAGLTNDVGAVSGAVDAISGAVSSLDIPTHQEIINASGYAYSQSTAWCDSQGYLKEHQDISYLATKNEVDTVSSFLSGAIDYVSANAGDEFPSSANDAITAYQTYSGTYLSNASAEVTYQPIGQYASASDITGFATKTELETTSGEIVNLIPSTAGLATEQLVQDTSATITGMIPSTAGLATETDLQIVSGGVDYISGVALTSIPTGTMNITGFEYDGDDLITAYNGSAFAGQGGGSIDTIPVAVISPLVTGFSGESAYLGIESTALNLSSYVPVSAIGVNSQGYVSGISGKNISAYYSRTSLTSNYANTAERAYHDRNNNEITSYYQPKLTITGDAGTITSINGSAVGASIPEGWELVAGAGISIVDDAENNQTIISAAGGGGGGNPEVESYVQTNSASIDDAVSTYQTNSATYLTSHQAISANEWNSNYETVNTNSSTWGGESTAYVPYSALNLGIGSNITAGGSYVFAQGNIVSAIDNSLAQGNQAYARENSFAQGNRVTAHNTSFTQGYSACAKNTSFAQGTSISSNLYSYAAGFYNKASQFSQAIGHHLTITNSGMAIGAYNKTSSDVSFVVGNGSANSARSDSFIIYHDGSVSAMGKISANGVGLGAGGGGGTSYTGDAQGALDEVYTNSANWNDNYSTVTANSASWGGTPLPISAGAGISLSIVDGVLVISLS